VIVETGTEPMGIAAYDAADIRAQLGDVALCAPTTLAALVRAGWDKDTIHVAGQPLVDSSEAA
jgi:hypothetical protein